MPTITSTDGTTIAYERGGDGPPLVLVDGAMCHRAGGPMRPLAAAVRDRFTVYAYDRRGRGESTDTLPYAVEREIEDLRALVDTAGGEVYVYAISSGAALAIATAAVESGIVGMTLYEPPYTTEVDDTPARTYTRDLRELLAAGRRGDAVARFMRHVGIPEPVVAGMRSQPGWAAMEAIATTLAYDDALMGGGRVPVEVAAAVRIPTLVMSGGDSPEALRQAAKATAQALPLGESRTLAGQTHDVAPDALAPVLAEFFDSAGA